MEPNPAPAEHAETLFRPSKRRKVFARKRPQEADEESRSATSPASNDPSALAAASAPPAVDAEDDASAEEGSRSVAAILRQRKNNKARRGGIGFSKSTELRASHDALPDSAATKDESQTAVDLAVSRFAPQTGLVADTTNAQMMAYIDSKMAEMRQAAQEEPEPRFDTTSMMDDDDAHAGNSKAAQRHPAGLGKLQEIDLGPDAMLRNIARTEAAHRRRLETGRTDTAEEQLERLRLGKDGKPRGGKKRRNSEDIRRDQLVEEVLRESRLDIYEEPEDAGDDNDDQAADDRIAEQFRREFLDAQSSRNTKKKPPASKDPKADKLKGPKLGGSRNARAAMHRAQEEAKKKR